ncbi:MAG: 2-oxoglutarate ferredoxin oxidoreductase subunit alpha [Lysobacterales bacterium]|jgi:2-oxoglutarate ferredoxin oxidoreductase subunit alpha
MSEEIQHISRFELLMDAGFGAQKAGDILIKAFAHTGRYVFIEPMIPAEISPPARTRPALSGTIIRVADKPITNIGSNTDLILAQHEIVLDRRLDDEEQSENCRVLLDMTDKKNNKEDSFEEICKRCAKLGLNVYPFDISKEALDLMKALSNRGRNMYFLGILSKIYSMPEEIIIQEIQATFGKKLKEDVLNKNIEIFHYGHEYAEKNINFSFKVESSVSADNPKRDQILIDGNTAMSMGIIDAGIKVFSGYPITPASSIMHTLAKTLPNYGGLVHQAEDEISAIGAAVGAYYGGVPAVTATSGPGLSLKQEFIGYAAVAEVPAIIIDVQRSGPSTGMPTKTEQSDLLAAIYGCHGDNTKIVISVGNVIDCFYAPLMARYLAEKLRLPVFIMSDFQIANSYTVIDKPEVNEIGEDVNDIPDHVLDHFDIKRLPDDIQMVRTDQSKPGTPDHMRRITGLNTDEKGSVNYFAKTNSRSHEIRNDKVHLVRHALKEPKMIGGVTEGDVLVIGWGSTQGSLIEAVESCQKQGLKVGGISLRIIYPLPVLMSEVLSRFKKVITVEGAYGHHNKRPPLAMFLRTKTLVDVQPVISRATGRPIAPKTIEQRIKECLDGHENPRRSYKT